MGDNEPLYKEIEERTNKKYSRKINILKSEISSLKQEKELLSQKKDYEYDETVISLKKENLSLIKEYEQRLSEQLKEIKELKKSFYEEKSKNNRQVDNDSTELKQEIKHLKMLLSNEKHDNSLLKNELKGLKIRETALIVDKESGINLIREESENKIKKSAMKIVLLEEENSLLKKKIEELEGLLRGGRTGEYENEEAKRYKALYLKEKKNYESLMEIFEDKSKRLENEQKRANRLETVTSKVDSIVLRNRGVEEKKEEELVIRFLMGVELLRLGIIHGGVLKD